MLGVIFTILKILGIIILVLLGAVAVLLLLLLFAPVRYCSKGSKQEDVHVTARATYLNPLIRVYVEYPADRIVTVKVLGITVYPGKRVKAEEKPSEATAQSASEKPRQASAQTSEEKTPKASEKTVEENPQKASEKATEAIPVEVSSKKSSEKQDALFKKLSGYAKLYQEHKDCVSEALQTILKALKTVLPKKCKVFAVVGTGEADTTGFLYAAYCAMASFLPGEVYLEPVWTERYLEGSYEVSGKIRLIHLVYAAIRIIADKRVRLLIKKLRRV